MSTESNKAIARRFLEEVFGQGKLAVADEIVAPDHVDHGPGALPGVPHGPEGSKMLVTGYRNAFPDIHFTIDEQIAEGDKVVTRWTGHGTHKGELAGIPAELPPRLRVHELEPQGPHVLGLVMGGDDANEVGNKGAHDASRAPATTWLTDS